MTVTRVLDRKPHFDPRSLQYRIDPLLNGAPLLSRAWRTGLHLDQGQDGACVGFAWTGWAAAAPKPVRRLTYTDAMDLYHAAQRDDETPGENYEGSSTLGGAKASQALGRVASYHWAKTIDEMLGALSQLGPVVVGIPWHEAMFTPDPHGVIRATGPVVGGHDILVNAIDVQAKRVRLHNSWGPSWGLHGDAWLSWSDMAALLADQGDCCLPVKP